MATAKHRKLQHEGMLHTVALSLKDQQVPMMDEAVDHCSGHLVIRKDSSPFGKLQICGEYQTLAFITVRYDVRRHIVGGANRILISALLPPRLCRIGTCRRLSAE